MAGAHSSDSIGALGLETHDGRSGNHGSTRSGGYPGAADNGPRHRISLKTPGQWFPRDRHGLVARENKRYQPMNMASGRPGGCLHHMNRPTATGDGSLPDDQRPEFRDVAHPPMLAGRIVDGARHTDSAGVSAFSSTLGYTVNPVNLEELGPPGEFFHEPLGINLGTWWMDILNPTEDEIDSAATAFSLSPVTVADIKNQAARERVDFLRQYYVVCFHLLRHAQNATGQSANRARTYAVVFPTGLLSFTFCPALHGHRACTLTRRRDFASLRSEWICYALLEDAIAEGHTVADEVHQELEAIEDVIHVGRADDLAPILVQASEKASRLELFLANKAILVNTLRGHRLEHAQSPFYDETASYLDHISDHISALTSSLTEFERTLSRLHSIYPNRLVIDADRAGRQLALIAFIIMWLNITCASIAMYATVAGGNRDELHWRLSILVGIVLVDFIVVTRLRSIRQRHHWESLRA